METIAQMIEALRERGVVLSVKDGKIIAPPKRLTVEEREFLKTNRDAVIAYLASSQSEPATERSIAQAPEPESPEAAYKRGHADGYALGIEHTVAEYQAKAQPVADKPAQVPGMTLERFRTWQLERGTYYTWEEEPCMRELREAMRPGDSIRPVFAYSCFVQHANGSETEFKRVPKRNQ